MCRFITVVIPTSANTLVMKELAKKFNFSWYEVENKSVIKKLNSKFKIFRTTSKMCDCGTYLGINNRRTSGDIDPEREIGKLKKKNWSDTKINRWIDQKQSIKNERESPAMKDEMTRWMGFIQEALVTENTKIHKLGILLHMYSGHLDTENIVLKEEKIEKTCEESALLDIEEDRVCFFIKEFGVL